MTDIESLRQAVENLTHAVLGKQEFRSTSGAATPVSVESEPPQIYDDP